MEYKLSKHAVERIIDRRIDIQVIDEVIQNPDNQINENECTKIFQKKITIESKLYLYRVYLNLCKKPPLVITAYKTTKIEKYEN
jgi:hypothetical protein